MGPTTWARRFGGELIAGLLLALLYLPLAPWFHDRFSRPDSFYSHGYLVPIIVGYLVYRVRHRIVWEPADGSWWGLALLVPGLLLWVAGRRVSFPEACASSLPIVLIGALVLRIGRHARPLVWPCAFLGFMVPLPVFLLARVAQTMKIWAVDAALGCLDVFGLGLARDGVRILVPGGPALMVGDECSGLRSLIALLALGCLYASLTGGLSRLGRAALVVATVPIAILSNMARIMVLCGVAASSSKPVGSLVHDATGLLVFAVALGLFALVERVAVRPWAGAAP
jgi:exosortase